MSKVVSVVILVTVLSMAISALAADKVVVVPLMSGTSTASASGQLIGGGSSFNSFGDGSNPNYMPLGAGQRTNDYDGSKTRVGLAGTITDFEGALQLSAGVGGSYTFTFIKNNTDQTLSCIISGDTDLNCTDLSNCVAVAAGDYVAVRALGSSATNRVLRWTAVFTPGASCN